jgi:hypothetical protein
MIGRSEYNNSPLMPKPTAIKKAGHPSDMWVGSYTSGKVAHDISIKLYDSGNQPPEIAMMSGDRAF